MRFHRTRLPASHVHALLFLAVLLAGATQPAYSLQVTSEIDRTSVRVGDTVTVTVRGERETGDPSFLGANVHAMEVWRRGGQTVQSPRTENGRMIKVWQFQLLAVIAGPTSVTPVIYLGPELSLDAQVDSVLGSPISLVIEEATPRRRWPWSIPPIIVILIAIVVARRRRRRLAESYVRQEVPPLAEALGMLDSIRPNRREDRAEDYLGDLEKVVLGFLTRRLGQPLTGRTAAEVQALTAPHLPDAEVRNLLSQLMASYSTAKFGAARMDYDALVRLEAQAKEVLERLEATWV